LRFGFAVVAVALSAAAFAILFRVLLGLVFVRALRASDVVHAIASLPAWARVALPMAGALAAGLFTMARARMRGAKHGVGAVMEAVVLGRVHLSMRATLLQSAASFVAMATGGSIGREGPLIQFGGAAGKVIAKQLGTGAEDVRILIAAGSAAGFAAAYNTPIAAVLFVLEIVTGVFALEAFVPVLVATVVATATTRAFAGDGPVYGARAFTLTSPLELVSFLGLGIFAALGAQLFMRALSIGESIFRRAKLPLPFGPAVGGALAGVVAIALPEVAGNGYEPLDGLLDGRFAAGFVALLVAGKVLATTASVSSGSPGGVFTPTLLIGGGLGFVYGSVVGATGLSVGPAAGYALVGMAAATAATTHAPLMAAVMVFELSFDYAIVLPLLLATAVATALSRVLRPESIYTKELSGEAASFRLTLDGRKLRP